MGVPVALVMIMIAALAGIGLYAHTINQRDALALADELLSALQSRIVREVEAFLDPAARMVRLIRDNLANSGAQGVEVARLEPVGMAVLRDYEQLQIVSIGDPQGNFAMLARQSDGAIDTKTIDRSVEPPAVQWTRREPDGRIRVTEPVSGDNYDPRVRPWYQGALDTTGVYWSDVYVFFTSQQPGVTAAIVLPSEEGEVSAVLGVDIALRHLSEFLGGLKIGENGIALIVDEDGEMIAYPQLDQMFKRVDGKVVAKHIRELENGAVTRAYNRYLVEGYGTRTIDIEGVRHISAVSSLHGIVQRNWSVLTVVPELDFVGFVTRNGRTLAMMTAGIVLLAGLLATLMVRQGLRADRGAARLLARQTQLEAQTRAFDEVASRTAILEPGDYQGLGELSEIISHTVQARRVSIWPFRNDNQILLCQDAYDADSDGHTRGLQLLRRDYLDLFEAIEQGDAFFAADCSADPRTVALHHAYLKPLGCESLTVVPVSANGRVVGAICLETGKRSESLYEQTIGFLQVTAGILGLRYAATVGDGEVRPDAAPPGSPDQHRDEATTTGPVVVLPPQTNVALQVPDRDSLFMRRLAEQNDTSQPSGLLAVAGVSVMVVHITDQRALAASVDGADSQSVVTWLSMRVQELAQQQGLSYLQFGGDRLVAAGGLDGDAAGGARASAEVALATRELCREIFTKLERRLHFRIGLDTASVVTATVGKDPAVLNLWGDALQTAHEMADAGLDGQVQATESSYHHLQDHYLFAVRGRYFVEDSGEIMTYLLSGRA